LEWQKCIPDKGPRLPETVQGHKELVQVSDMVQDNVRSFTAPQLAAMCGAYVQLCRHSYNDSQLFDAIVEQVLRSFKVSHRLASPSSPRGQYPHSLLHGEQLCAVSSKFMFSRRAHPENCDD
jgi:hypothetical protein